MEMGEGDVTLLAVQVRGLVVLNPADAASIDPLSICFAIAASEKALNPHAIDSTAAVGTWLPTFAANRAKVTPPPTTRCVRAFRGGGAPAAAFPAFFKNIVINAAAVTCLPVFLKGRRAPQARDGSRQSRQSRQSRSGGGEQQRGGGRLAPGFAQAQRPRHPFAVQPDRGEGTYLPDRRLRPLPQPALRVRGRTRRAQV
jgi:hypothetical protein